VLNILCLTILRKQHRPRMTRHVFMVYLWASLFSNALNCILAFVALPIAAELHAPQYPALFVLEGAGLLIALAINDGLFVQTIFRLCFQLIEYMA
jgi:hypothetical protein